MKNYFRIKITCKNIIKLVQLILLTLISYICPANDSPKKDQYNIKFGYSKYQSNIWRDNDRINYNNFKLEFNYKITKNLEFGPYLGYSAFETTKIDFVNISATSDKTPAFFYGLNCNYILQLKDIQRLKFYLTGKVGGNFVASQEEYYPHGNYAEYAIGVGTAFYVFKGIGIFTEYTYGKYYFKDKDNLKFGVSVIF